MAEVQAHGNDYEDHIIFQRTGLSKNEYDKLKTKSGYTSPFDLVNGLLVDYNASVKAAKTNVVCCADAIRMFSHNEPYQMIIGCYTQIKGIKKFHTQYEFYITVYEHRLLWGDLEYESLVEYVEKIKSVEHGRVAQAEYQKVASSWKTKLNVNNSLFIINPKIDSKKQRRVQCSIHLNKLLAFGVKYNKTSINININSNRRTFQYESILPT